MTNPERDPAEILAEPGQTDCGVEVLVPREVPLGGPRAMHVRRTLPSRRRSLIGAWCFVDHYGPDQFTPRPAQPPPLRSSDEQRRGRAENPVADTGGMSVAPHPHTGLQTVSWLFAGEIEHRDSAGNQAMVRPGEVNLMTAGRGISHSEVSTPDTGELHGVQLWVALPDRARGVRPRFTHHAPPEIGGAGWTGRVFLGSLLGHTSPVTTYTPLLGAELSLAAGTRLELDVDSGFEHGVLVDHGVVSIGRAGSRPPTDVKAGELAYLAPGPDSLALTARDDARVVVLGGPPLGEAIVMWWNFVGRTHEEIVGFRDEWQAQITESGIVDGRFGVVSEMPPIPAPPMPNARLRSR